MNQLEQLKHYTTVVADTGDFQSIERYSPEDSTTNPSLILKAVQKDTYESLLEKTVRDNKGKTTEEIMDRLLVAFGVEILKIVPGAFQLKRMHACRSILKEASKKDVNSLHFTRQRVFLLIVS